MTPDTPNWDAVYKSNFAAKAFWEVHWIEKARDLYESAKKLEPAIDAVWDSYERAAELPLSPVEPDHFIGTYFMLMSFAVENLLKAAAVSRNRFEYKRKFLLDNSFPSELKEHDLVRLAKLVDLALSSCEEDLLRRLTRSAVWFGRYPVPLKYGHVSGIQKYSDDHDYSVSWFGRDDGQAIRSFVDGLPMRLKIPQVYWKEGSVSSAS